MVNKVDLQSINNDYIFDRFANTRRMKFAQC